MAFKRHERRIDAAGLQVRSAAEDVGDDAPKTITLTGHAAVFDDPTTLWSTPYDKVIETIKPGAFARAINEGQDVRALVDHNSSLLLGRTRSKTLRIWEDDRGLAFELRLPETQVARDLAENIRLGNVSQCSFAFAPVEGGETSTTEERDGLVITTIELTDVDLFDVSIVTYPAYPSTSVDLEERGRAFAKSSRGAKPKPPQPPSHRRKSAALKVADHLLSRHSQRAR